MRPIIYQVLPRLYGNVCSTCTPGGTRQQNGSGKLSDFTSARLAAIRSLGATHIWYTGIIEHATLTDYSACGLPADDPAYVKGQAGSPYAIRDYYNIDPDLATDVNDRLGEFDRLVRRTHRAGLKVIIDFVPNHVAHTYTGTFRPFTDDNFYPGRLCDGDWTDTAKLNYGHPDTWDKMRDILLFWASRGIDGFRCDMAELVPVEFWHWVIPQIKAKRPTLLFIAEVYQPWQYQAYIQQGGFDYLYDKVGLYDTLIALLKGQQSATAITRCWQQTGDLSAHMLHFLENHDEQRLASDFICGDGLLALPALLVAATMDSCPFMLYFGQELGERGMEAEGFSGVDGKTTIFDYWSVPTVRTSLLAADAARAAARKGKTTPPSDEPMFSQTNQPLPYYYSRLLPLLNSEPALREGKFFDLMYVNPQSEHFNPHRQYAFLRHEGDELLLICANFDHTPADVRIRIPQHAFDYLHLPVISQAQATELISGHTTTVTLTPECEIPVHVEADGGVILKISY